MNEQKTSSFDFFEFGILSDGDITLNVREFCPAEHSKWRSPTYRCNISLSGSHTLIGSLDLRIHNSRFICMYGGHIGYRIRKKYRGNRYAAKACLLIKPIALSHGLTTLWITCTPDNHASRRTCERIGCTFVEIVALPPDTDFYRLGERQKCRYRWDLSYRPQNLAQ